MSIGERDWMEARLAAGTLDGPTGLHTVANIYMDDAGDYYRVDDGLPVFPGTMSADD